VKRKVSTANFDGLWSGGVRAYSGGPALSESPWGKEQQKRVQK